MGELTSLMEIEQHLSLAVGEALSVNSLQAGGCSLGDQAGIVGEGCQFADDAPRELRLIRVEDASAVAALEASRRRAV